ncbi:hypothetical protein OS493_025173 [Desmophyllum pertusum]|uniref:Uncharacterized protein n=1 Tax=Desmophyllum pertusum TaxID=174260 RepID=A0A9W9ZZQ3_9CNID|nr:hypothetical protein OS493_025173 [Desmophyllum pertusum]
MFCSSCYDREHCGNERKSQHGKLTELRAICSVHKHTLDYFNLTLLQPMCVICKKETILAPEHAHHVIENIETTVPKLRSLIEKKLESSSELIDRLTHELAKVEKDARRTTTKSIIFIQRCFVRLRHLLDQREVELLQGVRGYFDEFVEDGEGRVEAQNALSNLKALSEEGKLLLNKDARSLVVEFPSLFMRLKDLCSSTAGEQRLKKLKFVVDFEESLVEEVRQAGTMKSYSVHQTAANENTESSTDANNNDRSNSSPPDSKTGIKRHFSDPPSSSHEELSTKRARNIDVIKAFDFTKVDFNEECNKLKSPRTPLKASTKIASPPRKLFGQTTWRAVHSPQQSMASPSQKATCSVASPRRRRGGELSKEFMKCDTILTELWSQDESYPFARPVDKKTVTRLL